MAIDPGAGRTKKTLRRPELALPTISLLALPVLIVAGGGLAALASFGVAGAVLYALLLVPAVRLLRCRVTLTKDEIVQHDFLGSRHTPARDVTAVKVRVRRQGTPFASEGGSTLGPPPYPTLHLTDGGIVGLPYAGGHVVSGWRNAAVIREFYDHLADAAHIATSTDRSSAKVTDGPSNSGGDSLGPS